FVPLFLLAAAAAINIAAADCGVRVAPARSDVASIAGVGAFAGFLIGVVYTAAGVDRGAAVTLGRAEFAAAAAVAVAAHVVGFTSAALVVGIVRRTSRRWRWSIAVERFVIAACAAVAGAIVVRRSLLSALVL